MQAYRGINYGMDCTAYVGLRIYLTEINKDICERYRIIFGFTSTYYFGLYGSIDAAEEAAHKIIDEIHLAYGLDSDKYNECSKLFTDLTTSSIH
jgi:hypothetical protein